MTIDPRFADLRREALAAFRPPPKLRLSEWIEANVFLPSSLSATPGRMRLWQPQREVADAIGDDTLEQVVIYKSARVGATQLMVAALGHFVQNDPAPVLAVLPVDSDCRHFVTANVEPVFRESPILRSALTEDPSGRDTIMARHFPGGSLTVVSARAPRNLRARTARVLFADELDAWESTTAEGDPLELAVRRTATFGNRKLVLASTPLDADTSRILRAYEATDMRVYTLPCPGCGTFCPVDWRQIRWTADQPETAHWLTPCCETRVEDGQKAALIEAGRWEATAPAVEGRRGFRLTALTSTIPTASWPRLAAEFLVAKRSPDTLKPWLATALGEPWRDQSGEEIDESGLMARRENITLDSIPPETLFLTAGCDVQKDRIEVCSIGWTAEGVALVLAHETVWGDPTEGETWGELDDLLLRRDFRHPAGGTLRYDCALVDSGDGGMTDQVYQYCRPRAGRRVFASKGVAGLRRPLVERAKTRGIVLQLVGADVGKTRLLNALRAGTGWRFSMSLGEEWFHQLASERRVVRFTRGQPVARFERIPGRRAEALDCVVLGMAARALVGVAVDRRAEEVASLTMAKAAPTVIRSKWLNR